MSKGKRHFSKPHRNTAEVIRDMQGVAKFHRTGNALSWQDMTTIYDYVAWFRFKCREDWVNKFHAYIDSYWYQYECGNLSQKDLEDMAWDFAGIRVQNDMATAEDVKQFAKGDYMRMIGMRNLQKNNEILVLHGIHNCCLICALHDMGWGEAASNRFQNEVEKMMGDIYNTIDSPKIRMRLAIIKNELEKVGFPYEEIVDPLEAADEEMS